MIIPKIAATISDTLYSILNLAQKMVLDAYEMNIKPFKAEIFSMMIELLMKSMTHNQQGRYLEHASGFFALQFPANLHTPFRLALRLIVTVPCLQLATVTSRCAPAHLSNLASAATTNRSCQTEVFGFRRSCGSTGCLVIKFDRNGSCVSDYLTTFLQI